MHSVIRTLLLAAFFSASSCATHPPAGPESELRAAVDRLIASDNSLDLDGAMQCYCADAVLVPPQGESIRGREAIRVHYAAIFAKWRPKLHVVHEETLVTNGSGIDRGRTLGQVISTSGGENKSVNDVYEAKLRVENGAWRVAELKWRPRTEQIR